MGDKTPPIKLEEYIVQDILSILEALYKHQKHQNVKNHENLGYEIL